MIYFISFYHIPSVKWHIKCQFPSSQFKLPTSLCQLPSSLCLSYQHPHSFENVSYQHPWVKTQMQSAEYILISLHSLIHTLHSFFYYTDINVKRQFETIQIALGSACEHSHRCMALHIGNDSYHRPLTVTIGRRGTVIVLPTAVTPFPRDVKL